MKRALLFIIPIITLFIACGGDDGVSSVKIWTGTNDISDFQVYIGSPSGAVPAVFPLDTAGRQDSARTVFFRTKIAPTYNTQLFQYMTFEFYEGRLTFVDSVGIRKTVAPYQFRDDSLFINQAGNYRFVAIGTTDTLYRTKSYARYIDPETGDDVVSSFNNTLNLESVTKLAGFSDARAITDPADTLIWLNAKYIFK